MPIDVARPSGAGAFTEWTSLNVSGAPLANHAAVSSQSSNQFIEAAAAGLRDRYTVPALPAGATTVSLVTIFALVSGDDAGSVKFALRLAGVESYGTTLVPLSGGYLLAFFEFPLAPGGLPWTVARRNAIQFGPETVASPVETLGVDECWLETVYADPDDPNVLECVRIIAPAGGRPRLTAPAARVTVPVPSGGRARLTAPGTRVTVPVPSGGRTRIRILPERD